MLGMLGVTGVRRPLVGRRFRRGVSIQQDAPAGGDLRGLASVAQLAEGADFIVSIHNVLLRRRGRLPRVGFSPSAEVARWRRLACWAEAGIGPQFAKALRQSQPSEVSPEP